MRKSFRCLGRASRSCPRCVSPFPPASWLSSSYADFEKGELKGVSVRSDGRITLAPESRELFDSTLAYLWSIAADSHGVIYAGGGPGAQRLPLRQRPQPKKSPSSMPSKSTRSPSIARIASTPPPSRTARSTGSPQARKPEPFYNPHQKYIWAMAFNPAGDLFVATGDHGEIHRVSPDGKGSVFFHTEDTHVRTLAFSGPDLIAGTDPTGLVLRIDPQAQGFVLYQLPKREVTAVAVAPDGAIYAAGAGTQQTAGSTSAAHCRRHRRARHGQSAPRPVRCHASRAPHHRPDRRLRALPHR